MHACRPAVWVWPTLRRLEVEIVARRAGRGRVPPSLLLASSGRKLLVEALDRLLRNGPEARFGLPVGPIHDREELVRIAGRRRPDLILLDVDGGSPSQTIDTVRRVKAASPETTLLILFTSREDHELKILDYVDAGADGFLDRATSLDGVVEGLVAGVEGGLLVSESEVVDILRRAARDRDSTRRAGDLVRSLSPRELEVLGLIAEGLGNDEIAERLHVSVRTVATHVQNCYRKMRVHSRAEAVATANRFGLAAVGENG